MTGNVLVVFVRRKRCPHFLHVDSFWVIFPQSGLVVSCSFEFIGSQGEPLEVGRRYFAFCWMGYGMVRRMGERWVRISNGFQLPCVPVPGRHGTARLHSSTDSKANLPQLQIAAYRMQSNQASSIGVSHQNRSCEIRPLLKQGCRRGDRHHGALL